MTWTTGTNFTITSGWTAGTDFTFVPPTPVSASRDGERLSHVSVSSATALQANPSRDADRVASVLVSQTVSKSGTARDNERLNALLPVLMTPVSGVMRTQERLAQVVAGYALLVSGTARDNERLTGVAPDIREWLFLSGTNHIGERNVGLLLDQQVTFSVVTRDGEKYSNVTIEQALALAGTTKDVERNTGTPAYYLQSAQGVIRVNERLSGARLMEIMIYRERIRIEFPNDVIAVEFPNDIVQVEPFI